MLAMAVVALAVTLPASAYDYYYAMNVDIEPYPTGAGKVYASSCDSDIFKDQSTITEWTDKLNMKFATDYKAMVVWGKPTDGWQFAGYQQNRFVNGQKLPDGEVAKEVDYDEEGNPLFNVNSHSYPSMPVVYLQSNITATDENGMFVKADSAEVAKLAPEKPNNYVRVLFTHVLAKVATGQSGLGGAACSPYVNEIGDRVMLVAAPQGVSKFEGWYLNGELVSTDQRLYITVTGVATYEARFVNELAREIVFPAGGGTIEWYSDYDYELNEYVSAYSPKESDAKMVDISDDFGNRETWLNLPATTGEYSVLEGKRPALLRGSASMTLYPLSDSPASPKSDSFFKWSGENGVRLVSGNNYYLLSASGEFFELYEGGKIEANRIYMILPDDMLNERLGVPDKIYVDKTAYSNASGIEDITIEPTAKQKGTFTLDGRRVDKMDGNGIYITDGKKIYYRQR